MSKKETIKKMIRIIDAHVDRHNAILAKYYMPEQAERYYRQDLIECEKIRQEILTW